MDNEFGFAPPGHNRETVLEALVQYGLSGRLKALEGERDQNFRLTTAAGENYLVKISGNSEDQSVVDFQTRALLHIKSQDSRLAVPIICKNLQSGLYSFVGSQRNILRVLTYLDGIPMGEQKLESTTLANMAGIFVGSISRALRDFSHPAQAHFLAWDMCNGLINDDDLWAGAGDDIRALEGELRPRTNGTLAQLGQQRKQVVHNDAHPDNLLISGPDSETITGLIDFGDIIHTALVCDMAILCLGFSDASSSPQQSVAAAVAGYHSEYPLLECELDLVYDLMLVRATLTVLLFDYKIAHNASASTYVHESRPEIMQGLLKLRDMGQSSYRDAIFDSCRL